MKKNFKNTYYYRIIIIFVPKFILLNTFMKKTILSIAMICSAIIVQAQKPAIPRDAALEARVEKTLAKMTLDEKIGQMLELNLDIIGKMTVELSLIHI